MDNISFKSRIRLVPPAEFQKVVSLISEKNFVKYPWTVKQSIIADKAYTKDIYDCTVCGFTDGQKVLLNHICPTNIENYDFNQIAQFIKNKVNLSNEYLQGFILGSKPNSPDSPRSTTLFDKFVEFMKQYKIPFSAFKGGSYENNVAYSSLQDEWLISNAVVNDNMKQYFKNPYQLFERFFDKVKVSTLDDISW